MYISLHPIKLGESKAVPNQVQLLRVGDFKSDEYGEFKITKEMLLSFKKNFDDKVRGYNDGMLPVDYFHENDKLAAGWISELSLSADDTELWAIVKWTPKASEMIANGELRYLSAEFNYDYRHNEGEEKSYGPTLFGAGLTNRPFIKGMENVVRFKEDDALSAKIALLIKEGYSQEQAVAIAKELQSKDKLNEKRGDEMTPEELKKKLADTEAQLAAEKAEKEATALKLSELQAAKAKSDKEAADAAAKADADKKLADQKAKFDVMLSAGKAVEAQREAFMAGDMVKFAELAKPLNTKASGSEGEDEGDDADKGEKDFSDEVMALAEPIAKEKNVPLKAAISEVLKSNKELNEKYKASIKLA